MDESPALIIALMKEMFIGWSLQSDQYQNLPKITRTLCKANKAYLVFLWGVFC